ncbi:hypothetical protein [Domibacillus tundrae]|uniref:hypothetical protein n=1 Tax=Domibacillus tundrae TaxID=1587527 RepID=UPI00339906FD
MKTVVFPGTPPGGKRSDRLGIMSIHAWQVMPKAGVCQQPEPEFFRLHTPTG